jgi:hypothetical protein
MNITVVIRAEGLALGKELQFDVPIRAVFTSYPNDEEGFVKLMRDVNRYLKKVGKHVPKEETETKHSVLQLSRGTQP